MFHSIQFHNIIYKFYFLILAHFKLKVSAKGLIYIYFTNMAMGEKRFIQLVHFYLQLSVSDGIIRFLILIRVNININMRTALTVGTVSG